MAKDVTLLIKLNDQASGKIGKITNSTKRLERAANGAQNSIRRTNKGIRETGRAADRASKGVNKLGKAIRGLAAGFGAFQAGKFVIFKTAELERQTKSLEVLTGSLGNARGIIKELQQFGAVTPFTSAELIETAKRLKAFGFETEQIVDVTKRLADVAGATGADLGGIATAFGQIQAKGRLQGEELLQLQERGIGLQDELVKMYGFTADEFRKALEGGRISADAVNVALQNITDAGGKYANGAIAQSETLSGKFSTLVDNITVLAQHIGTALSPALKGILSLTNQILAGFNDILSSQVARGVASTKLAMLTPGGTMGDIAQMRANVAAMPTTTLRDEASIQETARRLTDISTFIRELGTAIETRRPGGTSQEERDALLGLQGLIQSQLGALGRRQVQIAAADKPTVVKPPELLTRTSAGLTPQQQAQQAGEKRLQTLKDQATVVAGITEEERRMLELEVAIEGIERQRVLLGDDLADKLIAAKKNLVVQTVLAEQLTKEEKERIAVADRLAKEMEKQKQLAREIGQTIEEGIKGAIMGALDGSKSLSESLSGILRQLGGQFLSAGIGSIGRDGQKGTGLFGLLGFANGGRPPVGRPSIVGERGPELFVPDRAGTIIPNGAMGGANVTVNVDASGSSVEGNADQASQLGKAIGIAVQQELVKQKRPGGLLAS
nr:phage tape measure protein [uncultured Mediterranean phage uvMED]